MPQTCFSYNHDDPSDFSEKNLHVFISYDNQVYPCCMTGGNRLDGTPLGENTLRSVLDDGLLEAKYHDRIESDNPSQYCIDTCS
jgi:hypothetical protein